MNNVIKEFKHISNKVLCKNKQFYQQMLFYIKHDCHEIKPFWNSKIKKLSDSLWLPNVNEKKVLNRIRGRKSKIIVTPIGGQGFIFGRGNKQISAKVIKMVGIEHINVISTRQKLQELDKLRVDTGDSDLDNALKGEIKVIVGYNQFVPMTIE